MIKKTPINSHSLVSSDGLLRDGIRRADYTVANSEPQTQRRRGFQMMFPLKNTRHTSQSSLGPIITALNWTAVTLEYIQTSSLHQQQSAVLFQCINRETRENTSKWSTWKKREREGTAQRICILIMQMTFIAHSPLLKEKHTQPPQASPHSGRTIHTGELRGLEQQPIQ